MRGPIRFDGPGAPITVQPRGRIVADDFLFVREAAGAGVAVMASLFAAKDVAEGRLVSLFPRHLVNAGGLYLSYPTTRHLPRKVTAFRNMLVEVMEARSLDALGG
jgi:DNA-binding transcriptional LysR family regulator